MHSTLGAHRVFLAGYSMGGFSVFKIGPTHADRWAGVMCISGAILNSGTSVVSWRFRNTPIYVVTGSKDENIPTEYGELTAAYLSNAGVPVSFYEQEGGLHFLLTLMPSLTQAWHDMIAGTVRAASNLKRNSNLPSAPPTPAGAFKT